MNEYTKKSIDFAFDNKLADMQSSIEDAIKEKVLGAIEAKKIEVAQNMFGVAESYDDDEDDDVARADRELARMKAKPIKAAKGVDPEKDMTKLAKKSKDTEEVDEALKGKQHKLDKNKNGKLDAHDFKLLRKESEELEEKLSVSDGVDTWISDFVHSDDPKFKGKSKKERIQMALGAFYSAKKGKTRNEEVDESVLGAAALGLGLGGGLTAASLKKYGKSKRSIADRLYDTKGKKDFAKYEIKQAEKTLSKSKNPKTIEKNEKRKSDAEDRLKKSSYIKSLSPKE